MIQPLLPLSTGHTALVLASGLLDGKLRLADGSTVIIKAISSKAEYEKSNKAELKAGITYKAVVTGERPQLRLRVLSQDGTITEYS